MRFGQEIDDSESINNTFFSKQLIRASIQKQIQVFLESGKSIEVIEVIDVMRDRDDIGAEWMSGIDIAVARSRGGKSSLKSKSASS